jgi:hypothetical protein
VVCLDENSVVVAIPGNLSQRGAAAAGNAAPTVFRRRG